MNGTNSSTSNVLHKESITCFKIQLKKLRYCCNVKHTSMSLKGQIYFVYLNVYVNQFVNNLDRYTNHSANKILFLGTLLT